MKVIYKNGNNASLHSSGIKFISGMEYEVTEKVAKYLTDTFGDKFKIVEKEVKAEPKEVKVAAKKTGTRAKPVKKVTEE